MNLENNVTTPDFSWDIRIDRTLQQPVKVYCAKQNIEIRKFISDTVRKSLSEHGVVV
ncbi:MAG: hypothetical protein GX799_00075 [Crenarchaeota archaeon]|nr:hypothetical protein [Thermoproteota archaeon]